MIAVVFGILGWTKQNQQNQLFNAVDSGQVGKTQFTAGMNETTPVGNSPFGNYFRIEFLDGTDADAVWAQIKTYLANNPPVAGSRIRRLDCTWDESDPTLQLCAVVEQLTW